DLIEHRLHAERRSRFVDVDLDAERAEYFGELGDAVWIGRRVDTPHRGSVALAEEVTDRVVRRDHEFFDELIRALHRRIALRFDDVAHEAWIVGVEHDL